MSTKITVTSAWSRARTPEEDRCKRAPRAAELRSAPSTVRSTVCDADCTRAAVTDGKRGGGEGTSKLTRGLARVPPRALRSRRSKSLPTSLCSSPLCSRLSMDETDWFATDPMETDPVLRLKPLCALSASSSTLPGVRAVRLRGPHSCEKDMTLEVRLDAETPRPLSEPLSPMIARRSGPRSLRASVSRFSTPNPPRPANAAPFRPPPCRASNRLPTPPATRRAAIFPSCSRDHWSSNTSLATGGGMIEHASILCACMAFSDFALSMVMSMTPFAVTPTSVAT